MNKKTIYLFFYHVISFVVGIQKDNRTNKSNKVKKSINSQKPKSSLLNPNPEVQPTQWRGDSTKKNQHQSSTPTTAETSESKTIKTH